MIPSFYQVSDGFPRLPNGKINKKALLFEIKESENKNKIDFDSLSATEKKLINLWETVLKIKNIDLSRNLFDNGGTSLQSIYLASLISKEFNVTFTPPMIFEFPKIKDQSEYLSGERENSFSSKKDEINKKIKSKKNINFKRRQ
jgi:acyl carrier protein